MPGRVGVILAGAGESRRMEGIDKVFAPLRGRPILDHSFGVMASVPEVAAGVVVLSELGFARGQEVLEAAGAKQTWADPLLQVADWHLMGTARMGTDPATSVVNEWGRAHDVKNLFIIDGSIFVTAGAVNPTNTIQALSLYIADRIAQNLTTLFD